MINLDELSFGDYVFNTRLAQPGAYILKHTTTQKYYIGSTINLAKRVSKHLWRLKNNCHENKYLQNAYNSYPDVKVLMIVTRDRETAFDEEQRLLDTHFPTNKLFNVGRDAKASQKGIPLSEVAREKIRLANLGKTYDQEAKDSRSRALKGIVRSEETRRKMSEAKKGTTHSAETRLKISLLQKGKKIPEETRKKMSLSQTGRIRKAESNEKARQTQIRKSIEGTSPTGTRVSIQGTIYPTMNHAARQLSIDRSTLRQRVLSKNPLFDDYFIVQ